MGIYSLLLSLGALAGSLMGAWLGNRLAVDGLIFGTLGLTLMALTVLARSNVSEIVSAGTHDVESGTSQGAHGDGRLTI